MFFLEISFSFIAALDSSWPRVIFPPLHKDWMTRRPSPTWIQTLFTLWESMRCLKLWDSLCNSQPFLLVSVSSLRFSVFPFDFNLFWLLDWFTIAVTGFTGRRYNNTSILLSWTASSGTTAYSLTQADSSGNFIASYNFTVPSPYILTGVAPGVLYTFTIYAGNSHGIDITEGITTQASTLSIFWLCFPLSCFFISWNLFFPLND